MSELCDVVDVLMREPDLTGDLLLFAVAFAHATDPDYTSGAEGSWEVRVGERTGFSRDRIRGIIASDRPRYEVTRGDPMCTVIVGNRRCGRPGESAGMLRDVRTGEGTWWSACRAHRRAAEKTHARNIEAWNRAGCPEPAPNRGGVLPRFFDQDWATWYAWAAPTADPVAWPPVVDERPRFTVIRGGGGGGG